MQIEKNRKFYATDGIIPKKIRNKSDLILIDVERNKLEFVDMLKVKIVMEKIKRGKDKMDIEFYTMEDLQRIHQEYVKGNVIEFSLPYAISEDKNTMIAYRTCRADRQNDGNLKMCFPISKEKAIIRLVV